jgi:hypothetical protein
LTQGANDVTATSTELNLLDLAGLTVGWVLSADSATTASWKAPTGGGGFLLNTTDTFTGTLSLVGSLSITTGDFTSRGIDDNCTLESLQLTNNAQQVGRSGASYAISRAVSDQSLVIAGGSSSASGTRVTYFGATGGNANDMNIRNDGGTFYIFDESGGDHLFYSGIGVKTLTLTLDETNQGIFSGDLALGRT